MSWMAVAEKDFRDAIRSRLLIGLTALFALFSGAAAFFVTEINTPGGPFAGELTTVLLISGLVSATRVFIPIVAIAVAYRSLAGERESGSLKVLLSLPNSRADVVLGKFVGRAGVVSIALLIGFALGLVVTAALADAFSPGEYLVFVAVSLLFSFVFVAITVGVSAFTESTSRAAYGAFGLFIVFHFLWDNAFAPGVVYVLNGFSFEGLGEGDALVDLFDVLVIVNPATAYEQATLWVVRLMAESESQDAASQGAFYLQDWFGFVTMAVWILVPLAVGYLRFESSDL